MTQNRNKLIKLLIGNISNSIVHQILEMAVSKEIMAERYRKELVNSFEVALRYRKMLNPVDKPFLEKDMLYIRTKIIEKSKSELMIRISKGYKNIDLDLVEKLTEKTLKELNIL